MSSESRKFPRVSFTDTTTIEVSSGSLSAELEDLTVEGASFIIENATSPGTIFKLKFPGSPDIEPTELMTEVVRCDQRPDGRYAIAVKFSDADDQYLMDILSVIHSGNSKTN